MGEGERRKISFGTNAERSKVPETGGVLQSSYSGG